MVVHHLIVQVLSPQHFIKTYKVLHMNVEASDVAVAVVPKPTH